MNQQSIVKTHVEWKAKIPHNNLSPVTSPEFFMLGSEWRLEVRYIGHLSEFYCILWLCKVNIVPGANFKTFHVTTFIKRQNYELLNRVTTPVYFQEQLIANYSESTISNIKIAETFEIFCLFELPVTDELHKQNVSSTRDQCNQAHSDILCDLESLSLDLCNLLKNEASSSDILVRCGDCSHHAHKAVLETRSEVFAAMFRNKMVESETGVVEITDMDGADFELFLKFIYSGKIQCPSEDSATRLYAAGDKYAIISLKKTCSDYMVRNLNLKNCLQFLAMSERHGDEAFMGAALNFVAENLDGLDREEWSTFCAEFPKLIVKVYEKRLEGTLSKQISSKKMKCMEKK